MPAFFFKHFAGVAHALLLVRIGLAQAADVGRNLSHQLAVDARDGDVRLLLDDDVDARGHVEHDRVRVPEREDDLLASELRAVADADDVELALEPFGDAEHAVGGQAAREAVKLAELRILARRRRLELAVDDLEGDAGRNALRQLAFRALNIKPVRVHFDGDPFRQRDRFFSNS